MNFLKYSAILISLLAGCAAVPPNEKYLKTSVEGTTLTIEGVIYSGTAQWILEQLDKNKITTIKFKNSPGGWSDAGGLLLWNIDNDKYDVVVEGYCNSICATLFLKGKSRSLLPGSSVGFHGAYWGTSHDTNSESQYYSFVRSRIGDSTGIFKRAYFDLSRQEFIVFRENGKVEHCSQFNDDCKELNINQKVVGLINYAY